jgi:hypothetical protein
VNTHIPLLIQKLQKKGIKVMGLTNAWTGSFGYIENIEKWRVDVLASLDICFNLAFPDQKQIIFTHLGVKDPQRFPVYSEGILFSANLPKGDILRSFLEYIHLKPKKIIFIDDKIENLKSVSAMCKKVSIDFTGFEYKEAFHNSAETLNKKRALLQFNILEKEHKWLNDNEADERLIKNFKEPFMTAKSNKENL